MGKSVREKQVGQDQTDGAPTYRVFMILVANGIKVFLLAAILALMFPLCLGKQFDHILCNWTRDDLGGCEDRETRDGPACNR